MSKISSNNLPYMRITGTVGLVKINLTISLPVAEMMDALPTVTQAFAAALPTVLPKIDDSLGKMKDAIDAHIAGAK